VRVPGGREATDLRCTPLLDAFASQRSVYQISFSFHTCMHARRPTDSPAATDFCSF